MTIKLHKFHDAANIFPLMGDDDLAELQADIKANEQKEAIYLHEDKVLDGRNRYIACINLKIEPRYRVWDRSGSPTEFVVSLNLHRRHLTSSQRACVAVEIEKCFAKEAKGRQREHGGTAPGKPKNTSVKINGSEGDAREKAAKVTNTTPSYVTDAKRVKKESPKLYKKVQAGDMTLPEAKRELKGEPDPKTKRNDQPSARGAHRKIQLGSQRVSRIRGTLDKLESLVNSSSEKVSFIVLRKVVASLKTDLDAIFSLNGKD